MDTRRQCRGASQCTSGSSSIYQSCFYARNEPQNFRGLSTSYSYFSHCSSCFLHEEQNKQKQSGIEELFLDILGFSHRVVYCSLVAIAAGHYGYFAVGSIRRNLRSKRVHSGDMLIVCRFDSLMEYCRWVSHSATMEVVIKVSLPRSLINNNENIATHQVEVGTSQQGAQQSNPQPEAEAQPMEIDQEPAVDEHQEEVVQYEAAEQQEEPVLEQSEADVYRPDLSGMNESSPS
ncbi:hypothetical protein AgCh_031994 [Apium graveolens]